jgi:hypothetical protein
MLLKTDLILFCFVCSTVEFCEEEEEEEDC